MLTSPRLTKDKNDTKKFSFRQKISLDIQKKKKKKKKTKGSAIALGFFFPPKLKLFVKFF